MSRTSATLIVNADDFGLTEGTNRAIADAFRTGIVTSTSLLANGYAFGHAVELAKALPGLGIGVHFTLTEGPPVAPDVPELLGADGLLPLSNQPFVRAALRRSLPREAIRREFEAQVARIIAAGITPTHVDGHKYIHLLPGISEIVAEVACQYDIPVMRVPRHPVDGVTHAKRLPGLYVLTALGMRAVRIASRAGLHTSDYFAGFVDTGHLDQSAIRRLTGKARPGVTELLCHPAYRSPALDSLLARGYRWIAGYDFDGETAAVSDPAARREIEAIGWSPGSFAVLRNTRQ